jgi:hypothetical protein
MNDDFDETSAPELTADEEALLARIIHQPQKSTTESACDVRITPAQSHHRISRLLKPAPQVVLALHQSVDLLPPSTQHPHSPLGLTTSP